jgi:hypothetical protein
MKDPNSIEKRNQEEVISKKVRRIQAIHGNSTFILVIPKEFASELRIEKGDYVRCFLENERLVVTKIEV